MLHDNDLPKTVAAIDPGLSGALCILDLDGNIVELVDLPTIEVRRGKRRARELDGWAIVGLFAEHFVSHVIIEEAQARPPIRNGVRLKAGIVSTGSYMESYGIIKGVCAATYKPISIVSPATWKRVMLAGKGADKGASIIRAKELYPHVQLDRKKDHHRAEALLLGWYGLHHILSLNLSSSVLDFVRSN